MEFKSFKLQNFKGICQPVQLNLSKDNSKPFCIIGNNESGKTTILTGVEMIGKLCKGYELKNGILNSIRPKDPYFTGDIILSAFLQLSENEVSQIAGKGRKPLIDLLSQNDHIFEIRFLYKFENSLKTNESKTIFIADKKIEQPCNIFEVVENHSPEIIYYEDFQFNVPDKIRFLKTSDSQKENLKNDSVLNSSQNKFWQKIFDDLLAGSSNKSKSKSKFQADIIDWTSNNEGDDDAVEQRIVAINDYLNNVVTNDWEDITGQKSIFDRFSIKRKNDPSFSDFTLRVEAKGKSFDLHERSKGCKWFFCFKILTDIRRHRNSNGTLFLLDEPASNLHIHPQEKILESLERLSSENGSSVIYSTHSPFLIKTENKDNIFIVDNYCDSEIEQPQIICTKFEDYKISEDKKNVKAIEPILSRTSMNFVGLFGSNWKEKIDGMTSYCADKAEKATKIVGFISVLKQLF